MPRERRRVLYSGRVQGVGFRYTAQRVAQGYEVGGHVRNLPDGGVELVAEGEPPALDAFLQAVRDAIDGRIRSEVADAEPPGDPPLTEFVIRY